MNLQWPEDSFDEECRRDDQKKQWGDGGDIGGELTEDALALRFSARHADDLRYIATRGAWLKWDGLRWYPEATHLAFDLARQSCRADAQCYGNAKPPPSVYSAKTIAAVERMAKSDRRQASTIEEWDADEFAFNTEEGHGDIQSA